MLMMIKKLPSASFFSSRCRCSGQPKPSEELPRGELRNMRAPWGVDARGYRFGSPPNWKSSSSPKPVMTCCCLRQVASQRSPSKVFTWKSGRRRLTARRKIISSQHVKHKARCGEKFCVWTVSEKKVNLLSAHSHRESFSLDRFCWWRSLRWKSN